MNFNDITFGNPTKEVLALIEQKTYLDDLFIQLKAEQMPLNDSELTKEELNTLVDYVSAMDMEENKDFLKRFLSYDRSLIQSIVSIFKRKGIDVEELCTSISNDINPLIAKLKIHFNRPRPFQLANYYKLKLFPYNSYSAFSPSYPSGHTIQAYVILNVLGSKYPTEYHFCKKLIDDIIDSRIYLGVHYPTDNDFAKEVGYMILKHKEFTKKYSI